MEEHDKNQDRNPGVQQQGDQGKTLKAERDISTIDQQEGNLQNGELGGNLKADQDNNEEQNKAPH